MRELIYNTNNSKFKKDLIDLSIIIKKAEEIIMQDICNIHGVTLE